jgi:hypothetical protein
MDVRVLKEAVGLNLKETLDRSFGSLMTFVKETADAPGSPMAVVNETMDRLFDVVP